MKCIGSVVVLVAVVGLACGPSIELESGASSSGGAGGSTTRDESTSGTPTIVPADSSSSGGDRETSGTQGSSSGAPNDCECPADQVIDFDATVPGGYSAADVLGVYSAFMLPWTWTGFDDSPTSTVMHVTLTYEGGDVIQGPRGTDGCGFLQIPCTPNLVIPVRAQLVSEDGIVDGSLETTVTVTERDPGARVAIFGPEAPVAELGGTLLEQPFSDATGVSYELETVTLSVQWINDVFDFAILYGDRGDFGDILGEDAVP